MNSIPSFPISPFELHLPNNTQQQYITTTPNMWSHFQSHDRFSTSSTNGYLGWPTSTMMRCGESLQEDNFGGALSDGIQSHSSSMSDIYHCNSTQPSVISPSSGQMSFSFLPLSTASHRPLDVHQVQVQTQTYYDRQSSLYPAHQTQSLYIDTPPHDPSEDDDTIYEDRVVVSTVSIVSQINGKRGARIKALATKFDAQIKTPRLNQRQKEFVIRGKCAEKVLKVKEEIANAAAHFSKLELDRQNHMHSIMGGGDSVTCKVHVPYALVGNMIGRNGVWARELQNTHHVYIQTPKPNKNKHNEPFLVMGRRASVATVVTRMFEHLCTKRNIRLDRIYPGPNEVHFVEFDPSGQRVTTGPEHV